MTLREEARQALHVYQSQTGLSLLEISNRTGYAYHSVRQFSSGGRYGVGEGEYTAKALMDFFAANPPARPVVVGTFYETECTRAIDRLLAYVAGGRNGMLYGPAGAQKSETLKRRALAAWGDAEPWCVYVECSPRMTPLALLRRVAAVIGAPYSQYQEGMIQAVQATLRRRRTPAVLMIDEAQKLCRAIDTFEMVRDIGDKAQGKAGILIAGNEGVFDLFKPRPGMYMEQWKSRIERKRVRVLGLSEAEAREIVRAELGTLKPESVQTLLGKPVLDPETEKTYISARRLFNAIDDYRELRAKGNGTGKAN
jgi:type II secretory pathway predicted ATPase ExeA